MAFPTQPISSPGYVLITGGGAGLGKALAIEFARAGYPIALVSLDEEELDAARKEIITSFPASQVRCLACDLSREEAAAQVCDWLRCENMPLSGLVNNVGMGYTGHFAAQPAELMERVVHLNVNITHSLTHLLLPLLKNQSQAFILNVSSMAGFYPIPFKTAYAASKSFVRIYSMALRLELRPQGIAVSCVFPGAMSTNAGVLQRIEDMGWRKLFVSVKSPEQVARAAVAGLFRGRAEIIPSLRDRAVLLLSSLLPSFLRRLILEASTRNSFRSQAQAPGPASAPSALSRRPAP
jgi:hypothetical protein